MFWKYNTFSRIFGCRRFPGKVFGGSTPDNLVLLSNPSFLKRQIQAVCWYAHSLKSVKTMLCPGIASDRTMIRWQAKGELEGCQGTLGDRNHLLWNWQFGILSLEICLEELKTDFYLPWPREGLLTAYFCCKYLWQGLFMTCVMALDLQAKISI